MIIFLNKLPIPNLRVYSMFSTLLLSVLLFYSQKIYYDLKNNIYKTEKFDLEESIEKNGYFKTTYLAITNEPWCVWVMINFCYCCLLLFSKVIQGIVFGKLRAVENQHIKDQFWNYIFLKFIFVFGVLNLENLNEVIMWCTWFSIIGFLAIHCQICKDRFEYLSFSANTPLKSHIKVLALLSFIQIKCIMLIVVSIMAAYNHQIGLSMSLFMFAESIGLTLRTVYILTKYTIHLLDLNNLAQWNNKGTITYYIDFLFEMAVISIDFLHYLHMLIYGNFYLSMASLVICMELKRLFFDLKKRMKRHSNYLKVIEKMEKRFPWATREELDNTDKCAVCWDVLDQARRLPCSHVFHHNCLRSWLEQDTSCPTCRKSLQDEKTETLRTNQPPAQAGAQDQVPNADNINGAQGPLLQQQQRFGMVNQRNLFHFDGSRYISWLPSFSLQVTNGGNILPSLLRSRRAALAPERLNEMTQQVAQMFPHLTVDQIQQDLRQTHSVEGTIENILEDRLLIHQIRRNPVNFLNEPDGSLDGNGGNVATDQDSDLDLDDDVDDDESTTEDEEPVNNSINNNDENSVNNSTNGENGAVNSSGGLIDNLASSVRHRNSLFTLFSNRGQNSRNLFNSTSTSNSTESNTTTNNNNQPIVSQADILDDSAIISKYTPTANLSENAKNLMQRKRDLILNSKKRFLEKSNLIDQTDTNSTADSNLNSVSK